MKQWSDFYKQSNCVFKLLAKSTETLFGQDDKLQSLLESSHAPSLGYLHIILRLNSSDDLEQFNHEMDKYECLYKLTFPERRKPLPNTPQFVARDVHQINVTTDIAVSSKALRPGETEAFSIWSQKYDPHNSASRDFAISNAEKILIELSNQGYSSKILMLDGIASIEIDVALACKLHHCNYIQVREETGTQYRAYIHRNGQKTSRQRLGVLIVHPEQNIVVVQPHVRETRSDDIYTNSEDLIVLPLPTNKLFYKKFNK